MCAGPGRLCHHQRGDGLKGQIQGTATWARVVVTLTILAVTLGKSSAAGQRKAWQQDPEARSMLGPGSHSRDLGQGSQEGHHPA